MFLTALNFNIVAAAFPIIASDFNSYLDSSWLGTGVFGLFRTLSTAIWQMCRNIWTSQRTPINYAEKARKYDYAGTVAMIRATTILLLGISWGGVMKERASYWDLSRWHYPPHRFRYL